MVGDRDDGSGGSASRHVLGSKSEKAPAAQDTDLSYDEQDTTTAAVEPKIALPPALAAAHAPTELESVSAPSSEPAPETAPSSERDLPRLSTVPAGTATVMHAAEPTEERLEDMYLAEDLGPVKEANAAPKESVPKEEVTVETPEPTPPVPEEEPAPKKQEDAQAKHQDPELEETTRSTRRAGTQTSGGTGAPSRDSADDSTPFTVLPGHGFSGTFGTFSKDNSNDAVCRKKCEDNPDCGGYSIQGGQCWANTNKIYTPVAMGSATLYHKRYRVQAIQPVITFGGIKIKSHQDHNCLDNPGGPYGNVGTTDSTTYTCDLNMNRNWTFAWHQSTLPKRGTFQLQSLKSTTALCMSADGTETAAKLVACSTSDVKQKWTFLESHQLRNQNLGRCLELNDATKAITLAACVKTRLNQRWRATTNTVNRPEYAATEVDMSNYGDQRYLVNSLTQVLASEFKCNDEN